MHEPLTLSVHIIYQVTRQDNHLYKDSCDDGEIGAGAFLLRKMKVNGMTHRAIYVARYCGSQKLGDKRLSSYANAVNELLKLKPMNALTRKAQNFEEKEEYQPSFNTSKKNSSQPIRGRGRGRARGGIQTKLKSYAQAASP